MNTVTITVIFCTTLEIHFVISHQEPKTENDFDDHNDKVNYDSDQVPAMGSKNIDGNEKFDDQELEAIRYQSLGSNEKLNDFNLDSTNDDDRDVIDPRTLIKDRPFDDEASAPEENDMENGEMDEEMEKEREAGDAADLFGTNQHYNIPVNYPDFGRRFVLTYPYIEKNSLSDAAETHLDNIVKQYLQSKKQSRKITPMKAPPEFVLEIAKQSALLEASKPKNPADEIVQRDILRTGNYWDGVWKEEVDVDKILRSNNEKRDHLDSIRVNILPGSKLHHLIAMLKHKSPRFLYVINKSSKIYLFLVPLF